MKRRCRIFGHRGTFSHTEQGADWSLEFFDCKRCGKHYDSTTERPGLLPARVAWFWGLWRPCGFCRRRFYRHSKECRDMPF